MTEACTVYGAHSTRAGRLQHIAACTRRNDGLQLVRRTAAYAVLQLVLIRPRRLCVVSAPQPMRCMSAAAA